MMLRDYQKAAVQAVFEAKNRGVNRALLALPTGSGKTHVAAHLIQQINWRTVFMVHRDELAKQTANVMEVVAPEITVGLCKAESNELHAQMIVASAQTLAHQSRLDKLKKALVDGGGPVLMVSDECFPAGTMISTPDGDRPIEDIAVGDYVMSRRSQFLHPKKVTAVMARPSPRNLRAVWTEDGHAVTATLDHPFDTRYGWRPTSMLGRGISVRMDDLQYQKIAGFRQVEAEPDSLVYNIEVESWHNYVANGFVVHNCHHDRAVSRTRAIEVINPDWLIGLTATPERGDKLGLDKVYKEIVHHVSLIEMIVANRLCQLIGVRVSTETDLDGVHVRAGELAENELAEAVNTDERNQIIVDAWKEHASDRDKTVAFCVDTAHAESLRDAFRASDISSEMVLGTTPSEERRDILERFHEGEIQVLCNCLVLTEGYDEPGIKCIIMARPTKSRPLYVQCVGRGARTSPGKDNCLVIDVVDVISRHKLQSLPSLAGKDELEGGKINGGSIEDLDDDREDGEIFNLTEFAEKRMVKLKIKSQFVSLFESSPHLWREVDGWFMAKAQANAYLTLQQVEDGWVPVKLVNYTENYVQRTRVEPLFNKPMDSEMAMGMAESSIESTFFNRKGEAWRIEARPATQAQVAFARKLGVQIKRGMTRDQVSEMIDENLFLKALQRSGLRG